MNIVEDDLIGTQAQPNKLHFQVVFIMNIVDDYWSIKGT